MGRLDDRALQERFERLNHVLFRGELAPLPVRFEAGMGRSLGKAFYIIESGGRLRPTRIAIRREHRWTERFLRKVLVHEMTHVWAYAHHNETGHGRRFWEMMTALGYGRGHAWADAGPHERDVW